MFARISLLSISLLLPQTAAADTLVSFADALVTWEASGLVNRSVPISIRPGDVRPPVGTPFTLSLTFNPSAAVPTPSGPPGTDCMRVPFSGSLTLGGASYTTGGLGFTHAALPGTNCTFTDFTQFSFHEGFEPTGDDPWNLGVGGNLLIASYRDLIVQDAFPEVPAGAGSWWLQFDFAFITWEIGGPFAPQAVGVEQPAPVPEPAAVTLFGLGLAALARRMRSRRSED